MLHKTMFIVCNTLVPFCKFCDYSKLIKIELLCIAKVNVHSMNMDNLLSVHLNNLTSFACIETKVVKCANQRKDLEPVE